MTAERSAKTEACFIVEKQSDGGYTAKAVSDDIFTEADNITDLRANILDAVCCHFHETKGLVVPPHVRLTLSSGEPFGE